MGTKGFFQFEIILNVLVRPYLFPLHLNTYVMGLRPVEIFKFLQCGDRLYTSESDVRRQILTYKDDPRTVGVKTNADLMLDQH